MNDTEKTNGSAEKGWEYVKLPDSEFAVMQAIWDEEAAGCSCCKNPENVSGSSDRSDCLSSMRHCLPCRRALSAG